MAPLNSTSFSCSGDGKIEQAKTGRMESSKTEIIWKSTERKSYKEYNHTRAIRIKVRFVKNTVKLPVVGMKVKKYWKELPLISLLQR